MRFSNGRKYYFSVPLVGILDKLYEVCDDISKQTEWWSIDDALAFVLCGSVPYAGVYPNWTFSSDGFIKTIMLTICGPATNEEIFRVYKGFLDHHEMNPKKLSFSQAKLLH